MLLWLLVLNALCLAPSLALPGASPLLSLEALVLWALLCSRNRTQPWQGFTLLLGVAYGVLAFLVMVDALVRESLGRGLNVYLELGLLSAGWNLLATNLGGLLAAAALLLLVLLLAAIGWLFRHVLHRVARHADRRLAWPLWLVSGLAIAGSVTPWVGSPALAFVANQVSLVSHTHQAREAFARELRGRSVSGDHDASLSLPTPLPAPLPALADRDVILGFIESYGISAITDRPYRSVVGSSLDRMADQLAAAGLTVATGRLRSPIQGGQSWLGHTSVLSGHMIGNQLAYETLLSSGFSTLIDDFRRTGHVTLAVMPAITRAWPEGRLLGYDRIYDHDDRGYHGLPFNWVTMPDQYTWYRFEAIRRSIREPVFAELALISSHAPWVPILPVIDDWTTLGRGEVFQRWAGMGEAPVSLWRDADRVREHYGRAIAYALDTAGGFASRYLGERALMILMGDHQPAPLITGEDASRDVVVHVISADPALVAPFVSGRLPAFRYGTRPELATPGAPMSRFRSFLHARFGGSGGASRPLRSLD